MITLAKLKIGHDTVFRSVLIFRKQRAVCRLPLNGLLSTFPRGFLHAITLLYYLATLLGK